MKITVAICTWNRAELLDFTLTQMQQLRIPEGLSWELLVVNNRCTDHTDEVIAKHAVHLPIQQLYEPNPGLSNARNCAMAAAKGDLLIWTDDDVLVDENWLTAYADAAIEFSDYQFFGGPVEPWFDRTPPDWLPLILNQFESAYAVVNYGPESIDFTPKCLPFGANFAIRTHARELAIFDPNLGRVGTSMVSGEETALLSALITSGHSGRYLPNAKVRHFIPRNRQNLQYLSRYYAGHGVQLRREEKTESSVQFLGRPRWLWKKWALAELQYRWSRLTSPPNVWIESFKEAAMWRGAFFNKT